MSMSMSMTMTMTMTKVPVKNHEMTHESLATFDPGGASPLGATI